MADEVEGKQIGKITHFFPKISVGVIEITSGTLKVGDRIRIKGKITDFEQEITSMQIEHQNVEEAEEGQSIGLKTNEPVKEHDVVYKLE